MALEGAAHGTAVLAETQTAGKGRLGRRFFSPEQSGVYLSMVLRPKLNGTRSLVDYHCGIGGGLPRDSNSHWAIPTN